MNLVTLVDASITGFVPQTVSSAAPFSPLKFACESRAAGWTACGTFAPEPSAATVVF